MKKKLIILTIVSFLLLALVACGGGNIVGVWEYEEMGETITLDFKEEGTVEISILGMTQEGTYSVDNSSIELEVLGQSQTGTFEASNDELEITLDGESQTFKKVK